MNNQVIKDPDIIETLEEFFLFIHANQYAPLTVNSEKLLYLKNINGNYGNQIKTLEEVEREHNIIFKGLDEWRGQKAWR